MPVPVHDTHPTRAGIEKSITHEMTTAGPFARLAAAPPAASGGAADEAAGEASSAAAPRASPAPTPSRAPDEVTLVCRGLQFAYPRYDGLPDPNAKPLFSSFDLELKRGSLCLLLGANGAGKTTLMSIIAGKHMVARESVAVLGRPPFHATELTTSGRLTYIGGTWQRDIAFAGYNVPLQGDFPARQMIDGIPNVDPARKKRLMEVLDINPEWRMHIVSEGQRRRVQLCVGLLRAFDVLLLDEVTVDLDVLVRADLMAYLREECEQRGCTIVYATHIFDGLDRWPTHLAFLARGELQQFGAAEEFPEVGEGRLVDLVERWLRVEEEVAARLKEEAKARGDLPQKRPIVSLNNGYGAGRMNPTTKLDHASNAVWRM